jgi:RHH-type transcriptional regulator, rel operon repressor / antitoxin RelB
LADPHDHDEAITSRPLRLRAIGRQTNHARRTTMTITSVHGEHYRVRRALTRLARSTDRSRSFLAAEAISEYLNVNEWQVAGIKRAIASLDRGEGVSNAVVKDWVASWRSNDEKPTPTRS